MKKTFGIIYFGSVFALLLLEIYLFLFLGMRINEECVETMMVERRFGVDVPLNSLSNIPTDHLIYKGKECTMVVY